MSFEVTPSDTIIEHQIDANSADLTVPTGEVWKVNILVDGEADFLINNDKVHDFAGVTGKGSNAVETVLIDGDTLSIGNVQESKRGAHIGGFEISNSIDNPVRSETIRQGESFTVPTGENWRATLFMSDNADVEINGVQVHDWGGDETTSSSDATTILTGGDTLFIENGNSANDGLHCGAFVF